MISPVLIHLDTTLPPPGICQLSTEQQCVAEPHGSPRSHWTPTRRAQVLLTQCQHAQLLGVHSFCVHIPLRRLHFEAFSRLPDLMLFLTVVCSFLRTSRECYECLDFYIFIFVCLVCI